MKKIIACTSALIFLASCGGTEVQTPEEALSQNQQKVISNYSDLVKATPEQSNSQGSMNFDISSKDGSFNGQAQYNFDSNNTTWETSGNMKISVGAETQEDIGLGFNKVAGNIDFDLVALKNKVFFKLNTLKVTEPENNPMFEMYISMVAPYLEKWYFLEDTYSTMSESPLDMFKIQKDIITLLENNTLLNHVATNENADYYDYNVELNAETVVTLMEKIQEVTMVSTQDQLTEEDFQTIRDDIAQLNQTVEMNIKISKDNLEHFIFTAKNEEVTLNYENSEKNISFNVADNSWEFKIESNFEKQTKGLSGTVKAIERENEIFQADINLTTDLKNTEFSISGSATDNNETINYSFNLADKTEEKSIEITEPTDARNFQEVIMEYVGAMMWGAQMQYDDSLFVE